MSTLQRLGRTCTGGNNKPRTCSTKGVAGGGAAPAAGTHGRSTSRRNHLAAAPHSNTRQCNHLCTPPTAAAREGTEAAVSSASSDSQPPPSSASSWLPSWSSLTSQHDKAILALAAPAALALAADPLLGMVDTALVGRLGADELAALGVNTSLFTLSFVVFNFLATATTPAVATAVGSRDRQAAGEVVYQATALAVVLGLAVAAGLYTNASWMLAVMGADPSQGEHMHELAMQYLMVRATAAPAVMLATVGAGVFRGLANMRAPLLITLGTNAVHLALDLVLMFHMGLGIKGAAISTAASEWLAAVAYGGMIWQRRDVLGLWPPPQIPVGEVRRRLMPFLQAGTAVVMRTGSLLGTKTLATAVAARLGPGAVASHQVLMQLWVLSSMLVDSLAVSGQTLIAVNLGKGETSAARQVSERLLQLGLGVGVGMAVLSGASAAWWPQLFTTDDNILGQIHQLVPLAVLPLPINALVYTLDGVLVGASDFGYLMRAMIGASAVAASLLVMVEPSGTGLEGVWAALAVLMVGRLATLGWRYNSADGPLPPTHLQPVQTQPQQQQQQHVGDSTHQLEPQQQQQPSQQQDELAAGQTSSYSSSYSSSSSLHAVDSSHSNSSSSSSTMAAAEVAAPLLLLNNSVEGSSSLRSQRRLAVPKLGSSSRRQAAGKVHATAAGGAGGARSAEPAAAASGDVVPCSRPANPGKGNNSSAVP